MFEKIKLSKDTKWLLLACIGIGALAAFPIVAHLAEAKLPEPVASLWGSALGAWAGIAGALWVAERQATTQRRAAAALVRQMFHPVAFALDELAFVHGAPSRPPGDDDDIEPEVFSVEKWREVANHAGFVVDHFRKFNNRIHRYEAGLNLLSAKGLSAALALETELEDAIRDAVTPLTNPPSGHHPELGVEFYAQAPSRSRRFALHVFNRHVQEHMAQLERMAR